jgi:hypothetical protein
MRFSAVMRLGATLATPGAAGARDGGAAGLAAGAIAAGFSSAAIRASAIGANMPFGKRCR